MTGDAPFLATMRESPDDPGARRVFADWLEEQGLRTWPTVLGYVLAHPAEDWPRLLAADWCDGADLWNHGEFIRLQVELAKNMGPWQELSRREHEQCGFLYNEFRRQLPGFASVGISEVSRGDAPEAFIRRGFVEAVRMSWDGWNAMADTLLTRQPVQRVTLTTYPVMEYLPDIDARRLQGRRQTMPNVVPPGGELGSGFAKTLLSLEWPGIEFTLPVTPASRESA